MKWKLTYLSLLVFLLFSCKIISEKGLKSKRNQEIADSNSTWFRLFDSETREFLSNVEIKIPPPYKKPEEINYFPDHENPFKDYLSVKTNSQGEFQVPNESLDDVAIGFYVPEYGQMLSLFIINDFIETSIFDCDEGDRERLGKEIYNLKTRQAEKVYLGDTVYVQGFDMIHLYTCPGLRLYRY